MAPVFWVADITGKAKQAWLLGVGLWLNWPGNGHSHCTTKSLPESGSDSGLPGLTRWDITDIASLTALKLRSQNIKGEILFASLTSSNFSSILYTNFKPNSASNYQPGKNKNLRNSSYNTFGHISPCQFKKAQWYCKGPVIWITALTLPFSRQRILQSMHFWLIFIHSRQSTNIFWCHLERNLFSLATGWLPIFDIWNYYQSM